jgi:spectinomycin phosphotransferase
MLEKPDLPDHLILSRLQAEYGLDVTQLTFLPLGYDVHTAVYRLVARDGAAYFLKLRKGDFDPIAVAVPQFLCSLGIKAIIAPFETQKGQLFGRLEDDTIILYPFIPGKDGYQVQLTDRHWIELGRTLKMVHAAQVPPALIPLIPREAYNPHWRESVKQFQALVKEVTFDDPIAEKLSSFMKGKREEISRMVKRVEELARLIQQQPGDFVLCHSDAHPGNYLIAENGELYLVDWDSPIFAPKERDLMFFGSGMSDDPPGGREEHLFYQGYGPMEINRVALVYYRYERIIQDIAEFCAQLLLSTKGGQDRQQSYNYLVSSFSAGNVVEAAIRTDQLSEFKKNF